jgi:predicted CXXCH cytochrome family protein
MAKEAQDTTIPSHDEGASTGASLTLCPSHAGSSSHAGSPSQPGGRWFRRRYLLGAVGVLLLLAGGFVFVDWFVAFPAGASAAYVGRGKCIDCHRAEHHRWKDSHHDKAMDLATADTVLGDFSDQELAYDGRTSRFTREGDKFFVSTDGPGGKPGKFEISYTFGVEPLQQYMVEMPRGRVQVLPFAWDTKGRRWFHLYQDEPRPVRHDDPLHWTQPGQNWNHVCADCHSTNLQKGYDNETDTFHTTYNEIDVSCEACHGPAGMHVELATKKWFFWDRRHGYGLAKLKGIDPSTQIDACARCHSHRHHIYPGFHAGGKLLDHYVPAMLDSGMYHDDGQIDEEVYEYGSFHQSLMHRKGVRCTDCHDPHTTKVKFQGNRLCTECHTPAKYDTPAHHYHKAEGAGGQCVECHMPIKKYMVVDPRRDHSLRIPRPDLSLKLGTPNACVGCHLDEKKAGQADDYAKLVSEARRDEAKPKERLRTLNDWAQQQIVKWYGEKRRDDPHYALALAAAMRGKLEEGAPQRRERRGELEEIASRLIAVTKRRSDAGSITRASAVSLLGQQGVPAAHDAILEALKDREPLVRWAAASELRTMFGIPIATRWEFRNLPPTEAEQISEGVFQPLRRLAAPLLTDSVRAVRFEAAKALAVVPPALLSSDELERLESVLAEYRAGCLDSGDQAASHANLAMLAAARGELPETEREYRLAMARLGDFIPARTGLAEVYRHQGKHAEAEELLRDALRIIEKVDSSDRRRAPQEANLYYQLGLIVATAPAEKSGGVRRFREARTLLGQAVRLAPEHGQARFALATVLRDLGDWEEAEAQYLQTYRDSPLSGEYRDGLASLYQMQVDRLSGQRRWTEALPYAQKLARLLPGNERFTAQLREIERKAR